jgi:hypothetical protein
MTHVVKNALDHVRGFGTRKAEPPVHDVGEVRARQSVCGVRFVRHPRDA